jgi:hypothetical protein
VQTFKEFKVFKGLGALRVFKAERFKEAKEYKVL